jgi:hypothetical protein
VKILVDKAILNSAISGLDYAIASLEDELADEFDHENEWIQSVMLEEYKQTHDELFRAIEETQHGS